jgi:DNA-binding transcriptional ArsR family regulator
MPDEVPVDVPAEAKNNDVDHVFHALGDATRRAMLERLSQGPLSVSALAAPLNMTLTAVVQHLQILEDCGLIRSEKVGRTRTCNIETAGFAVAETWIRDRRTVWDRRFDQLDALLGDPDQK